MKNQSEIKDTFAKYQKYLILALRNPLVRKLIGVDYMLPKGALLVGVHPSGISYLENNGQITSKFQTRPLIAEKLYTILSYLKYLSLAPAAMTGVPALALTVSTFVVNNADNSIYGSDPTTYATAHDATSGTLRTVSDDFIFEQNSISGGTYYVERAFLTFATGATIPSGSTITAASLAMKSHDTSTVTDAGQNDCHVVEATPADDVNIAAGDFDQVGATSFGSAAAPAINTAFTVTINATGQAAIVMGSGNTSWALRSDGDLNNSTPTGVNSLKIRSGNHATEADRPTLSVTWTGLPVSISGYKSLLGVGQA